MEDRGELTLLANRVPSDHFIIRSIVYPAAEVGVFRMAIGPVAEMYEACCVAPCGTKMRLFVSSEFYLPA